MLSAPGPRRAVCLIRIGSIIERARRSSQCASGSVSMLPGSLRQVRQQLRGHRRQGRCSNCCPRRSFPEGVVACGAATKRLAQLFSAENGYLDERTRRDPGGPPGHRGLYPSCSLSPYNCVRSRLDLVDQLCAEIRSQLLRVADETIKWRQGRSAQATNSWPSLADHKLDLAAGVGQVRWRTSS